MTRVSRFKFWLAIALTIGLIWVTTPITAQTAIDSANSQPTPTSITFKDPSSLFNYLSRLTNLIERPTTKWIWLDGRRIFQITATEDYLPERAQTIEGNFQQISDAYFQSDRQELEVNIIPVNGSPTIEINGQYLLTVTELDAKLLDISTSTRAKQLSQIVQQALIKAKQERQPQHLQRQSAIALGIVLAIFIINWLIKKLRQRIYPNKSDRDRRDYCLGNEPRPEWQWQILESKIMGVDDFSDRGLMVKIWIKTRPLKQWNVAREYRLRLKLAFDRAGISIPVPHQDISVRQRPD